MRVLSRNIVAGLAMMAFVTTPAYSRNASSLSSLVGARGSSGQAELERNGFVYITGHTGKSYVHSYYWHSRDKNCIEVKTANGEYAQIVDAANRDCNQSDGGGDAGAAIAGVAVAGLLVAALAHKGSHHDDGKHLSDNEAEMQYDRGYNDGLHNAPYHNYNDADAYSSGYRAGVDQRSQNTSYHSGRGGYAPHVSLNGLEGRDSVWAIDEMRARGFDGVDSFSSGNTTYGIYYNRSTGQCIQITNARSRVESVDDIGQHPNCR